MIPTNTLVDFTEDVSSIFSSDTLKKGQEKSLL